MNLDEGKMNTMTRGETIRHAVRGPGGLAASCRGYAASGDWPRRTIWRCWRPPECRAGRGGCVTVPHPAMNAIPAGQWAHEPESARQRRDPEVGMHGQRGGAAVSDDRGAGAT